MEEKNIFLIAGMSGAGKSVCLKHFEDREYEIIRGLPVEFLDQVINSTSNSKNIAIEIFSKPLISSKDYVLDIIKKNGINVIFLDAANDSLVLRYKESRRKHPLDDSSVHNGIAKERAELEDIRKIAKYTIDTTNITPYELKLIMDKDIFNTTEKTKIVVMSFSYKEGIPIEADCVFDVRFLKNPYYEPTLRPMDGTQKAIHEYLKNDKNTIQFISATERYLDTMIDLLRKEGRDVFYIAFGCTGGFHRSVYVAETIAEYFKSKGIDTSLMHRDLKIIKG